MAEQIFNFTEKIQQNRILLDRIISEQLKSEHYKNSEIVVGDETVFELSHLARLKGLREISKSKKEKVFLDIISRVDIYECIQFNIYILLEQLKTNQFVKMKKCKFLPNELHPDIHEIMNKCVYLKGGNAYKEYDKYLQSIVGYDINEGMFVPRTDDFDIIVAVDSETVECFMSFQDIIKRMCIQLSKMLLEKEIFYRITTKTLPPILAKFKDIMEKDTNFEIFNDLLLLSIRKHTSPGKSNWNYRLSLLIEVEGNLQLSTIIEIIVSHDIEVYDDINMLLLGNSPSFINKELAKKNLPTLLLKLDNILPWYLTLAQHVR
jgi:hypothetical protein